MKFDDAFHVAVVDKTVYFGSSVDNQVYAIDGFTGNIRWRFFTEGPVRLAPTVYRGKVYVGSDDGYVYCLDAAEGKMLWKLRGGGNEQKVLGSGKMISMWPIRTGVSVENGIAYFGAGVFPGERIYMYAVDANDGTVIWRNDTIGDQGAGQFDFTPHGYLLVSEKFLFATSGRRPPFCFSRSDGRYLYQVPGGSTGVGTYALLQDGLLYSGTQNRIATYRQSSGKNLKFAWAPCRSVIPTATVAYLLNDNNIKAIDRIALQSKNNKENAIKAGETLLWQYERKNLDTMVIAGGHVFAGGQDVVVAINKVNGKELWAGKVEGKVRGLAVANGMLMVSTNLGHIFCFTKGVPPAKITATTDKTNTNPYSQDESSRRYKIAAQKILAETGITRGYCLMLGCGRGNLAFEIAQQCDDLMIYCIDPDVERVAEARKNLVAAGVYGTKVCVDHGSFDSLPYSDYFANIVVINNASRLSDETDEQRRQNRSRLRNAAPEEREKLLKQRQEKFQKTFKSVASETYRVLKPCGGVLYVGQAGRGRRGASVSADNLRDWIISAGIDEKEDKLETSQSWVKLVRGKLSGAGAWTHQYGTSSNIASSDDQLVKAPLGVLWYGEPGPNKAPSRHTKNVAPLSINGRVFVQGVELKEGTEHRGQRYEGRNVIICFDAYNGVKYWEREIPGAYRIGMKRECSNLACTEDSLFVAVESKCYRLDTKNGKTLAAYQVPLSEAGDEQSWAYVAVSDGILFGSTFNERGRSKVVFAYDIETKKLLWENEATKVLNNTIVIGDGQIFFVDDCATDRQRRIVLQSKIEKIKAEKKIDDSAAEKELEKARVMLVVALDKHSGGKNWEKLTDFTDSVGSNFSALYNNATLLFSGAHRDTHYWDQFLKGEYAFHRMVALSAQDGSLKWNKATGHRTRPLIIGETIYADPWAFDLQTGRQIERTHPVTGKATPWEFERPGHGCGVVSGCPNTLLFRSYWLAYYDLLEDSGTMHFSGLRAGCWINSIPANGLVIQTEASSGCNCEYSLQCTLVLKPRKINKAWGIFASRGVKIPVQHLAINLGAPGDRRDDNGTLWVGYPRPKEDWLLSKSRLGGRLSLDIQTKINTLSNHGYFNTAAEHCQVTGTEIPWVFASGCTGMTNSSITLTNSQDPPASYTVRLGFAETEHSEIGRRVFDIKLQDNIVAKDFDIFRTVGGRNKALLKEFKGIKVTGDLKIELIPKVNGPWHAEVPIINCIEIIREAAEIVSK
jgi:outer membrane protein assembly factor BamB